MSFNLSISDVPTHVVVWQDKDSNSALIKSLTERITSLEATVMNLLKKETPLLSGLDVRRGIPPLNIAQETDSRSLFKELIEKPLPGNMHEMTNDTIKFVDILPNQEFDDDAEEQEPEAEETEVDLEEIEEVKVEVKKDHTEGTEAEDAEEQQDEGEEQQDEDAEEQQDEDAEGEEQQEEEQALELTEFEYKGVTYFRDPENQVYQVDSDGDLDDTPIGLWSEEKQKVLRFRSA